MYPRSFFYIATWNECRARSPQRSPARDHWFIGAVIINNITIIVIINIINNSIINIIISIISICNNIIINDAAAAAEGVREGEWVASSSSISSLNDYMFV